MAFRFEPIPVRDFDAAGRLTRAGLVWAEWRMPFLRIMLQMILLGLAAAAAVHFGASYETRRIVVPMLLTVTGFAAYAFFTQGRRSRELVFLRDGSLQTTFGLPFRQYANCMPAHHADIRSIERMPRGGYWFVDLYTATGAIVPVARLVKMSEAHMVVTQLNNALDELRRDTLASQQRRAQGSQSIN